MSLCLCQCLCSVLVCASVCASVRLLVPVSVRARACVCIVFLCASVSLSVYTCVCLALSRLWLCAPCGSGRVLAVVHVRACRIAIFARVKLQA